MPPCVTVKLCELRPVIEDLINSTLTVYEYAPPVTRLIINGVVVTVEVTQAPLVDMIDVSIFIERLPVGVDDGINVDIMLPITIHPGERDYDVAYVDVVNFEGTLGSMADIAELLKSDWNGEDD